MTNDEAIKWISALIGTMREETSGPFSDPEYKEETYEALDMAIKTLEQEPFKPMEMTNNNLCDSCTNIGCEFQSGIVRTECAFYMRPTIGSIPKEQYENRLKADMMAMLEELEDKILHGHTFDTGAPIEFQHGIDYARRQDLEIIRQKINALKGEKDGSN